MEKNRVAYILFKYPKMSETFIRDEIKEMKKYFNVFMFTVNGDYNVSKSLDIMKIIKWGIYLLTRSWKDIRYIPIALTMAEKVKEARVSHIHTWFASSTSTIAYIIHKETGIPFSFSAHSRDIFLYKQRSSEKFMKEKFKEAKFVCVPSKWHKDYLSKKYDANYVILPNSIYTTKFRPYNVNKYGNRIVTVGRDMPKKGFKYLKKALKSLSIPYSFEHINNATSEEVINKLSHADIFVLPCVRAEDGDMDGIPTTILEAMSMELPVVSSNIHGGLTELLDGCGLIWNAELKDTEELAEIIEKLLNNKKLRETLGKNGRKKVLEKYDIRKNAAILAGLIMGVPVNEVQQQFN